MSIPVIPSKAGRIRALARANPQLDNLAIARQLGCTKREVDVALGKGDRRRMKSVTR